MSASGGMEGSNVRSNAGMYERVCYLEKEIVFYFMEEEDRTGQREKNVDLSGILRDIRHTEAIANPECMVCCWCHW